MPIHLLFYTVVTLNLFVHLSIMWFAMEFQMTANCVMETSSILTSQLVLAFAFFFSFTLFLFGLMGGYYIAVVAVILFLTRFFTSSSFLHKSGQLAYLLYILWIWNRHYLYLLLRQTAQIQSWENILFFLIKIMFTLKCILSSIFLMENDGFARQRQIVLQLLMT